jgi:gas vesicle protein
MKNPFAKQDHTALIASIAIGSAAAGAATYLFTTEKGAELRRKIVDVVTGWFSKTEEVVEDHTAYLKKPHKSRKSDIQEVLEHGIIAEQPGITN